VTLSSSIEHDGFAVLAGALDEESRLQLIREIEECLLEWPAGVRGLAAKVPSVAVLARSVAVRSLVEPVLGPGAKLVRSILFNKNSETNWQVAWHQDLAIAVASQEEIDGYASWSVKDGVVHVQPPVHVLENMLVVRLHLDAADANEWSAVGIPGLAPRRSSASQRRRRRSRAARQASVRCSGR